MMTQNSKSVLFFPILLLVLLSSPPAPASIMASTMASAFSSGRLPLHAPMMAMIHHRDTLPDTLLYSSRTSLNTSPDPSNNNRQTRGNPGYKRQVDLDLLKKDEG